MLAILDVLRRICQDWLKMGPICHKLGIFCKIPAEVKEVCSYDLLKGIRTLGH